MRKSLFAVLMALSLTAGATFAEQDVQVENKPAAKLNVSKDRILEVFRPTIDRHLASLEANKIKVVDMRVSPSILCETYFEVPVELNMMLGEGQIPAFLKNLEESSKGKMASLPRAFNVSVAADSSPDGLPLLSLSAQLSLSSEKCEFDNSYLQAFNALAKNTTFTPQVKRLTGLVQGNKGTWLTNFRIDSDKRVMMTGYATDVRLINQLCVNLENSGSFAEMWLNNFTRNVYEKQPVLRFDICGLLVAPAKK